MGRPLHLILLAPYTNLGEAQAKLDAIAAARTRGGVTDALSMMLRLLGEESEEASWLIRARSRMEPIELCDEEW
jgi:hypothetical protein